MASTFYASLSSHEKNYGCLLLTIKALSRSQDIWEIVETNYQELEDKVVSNALSKAEKDLKKERKKDGNVLFFIFQEMDESILPRVVL